MTHPYSLIKVMVSSFSGATHRISHLSSLDHCRRCGAVAAVALMWWNVFCQAIWWNWVRWRHSQNPHHDALSEMTCMSIHRLNLKKSPSKSSIQFPKPDLGTFPTFFNQILGPSLRHHQQCAQSQRCHGRAAVHAETTVPPRGKRGTRRGRSCYGLYLGLWGCEFNQQKWGIEQ